MKNRTIKTMLVAAFATFMLADAASAYYSPRLGRFLSRDPVREAGAVVLRTQKQPRRFIPRDPVVGNADCNLYESLLNDPINRIDPQGLTSLFNPCCCRVYRKEIDLSKIDDKKDPEIGDEGYEAYIGHTWIKCGGDIYDFPRGFQDDRKEVPDWIWGTSKALLGKLKYGSGAGTKCICAKCADIKSCLQAVEDNNAPLGYSEGGWGILPPPEGKMNCRYHVQESLQSCCLVQNLFADKAFGIGFDDPIWCGD